MVNYLTDESDPERGYVKFSHGDEVAVVVNNFGGMSVLEMGALTDLFLNQLPSYINPVRVYTGMLETSLNAPAFSLTLLNITAAAHTANVEVQHILDYLDIPTTTAWEGFAGSQKVRRPRKEQIRPSSVSTFPQVLAKGDVKCKTASFHLQRLFSNTTYKWIQFFLSDH
jgi:triose/dihydroxyacetone kinase / FAD-AMP lyase (cyclizing)